MRTECSVVRDLLPLYVENLVSPETAGYVQTHLEECSECRSELESLNVNLEDFVVVAVDAQPFKKIMKRLNRRFYSVAYASLIFLIFLGFGWTGGENLMYNSIIMPIVGIFGYYVFRWKAIYKIPLLLLLIDLLVFLFQVIEIGFMDAVGWTFIYCVFAGIGILIAFLLDFALKKEVGK